MAKLYKQEKKIYEGCGVELLCEGTCRLQHQRIYDPDTKEVSLCPAYYKFTFVKERKKPGSRKRIKKGTLKMKELR